MTEKFGTLAEMIKYASKSHAKKKIRQKKAKIKGSKAKHALIKLVPTKIHAHRSKISILKFIKEVHE